MRRRAAIRRLLAMARPAAILILAAASGCRGSSPDETGHAIATGGDPARGRRIIAASNCGACHVIPGVPAARGVVAAPLSAFARRSFIAGQVPNTPENLVQWIRDPGRIEPGTAMPAVGLDEQQARDIAAYLYLLR